MKRALGTGFEALFAQTTSPEEIVKPDDSEIKMIKMSLVEPRKDQPRKNFDREQLQALASSIAEHGVIQPIIVTEGNNGYYSIIAGERRWRASKLANLSEIPAIVRKYTEMEIAEVALIENLQREDLNPIEEAQGYKTLMDKFGMTALFPYAAVFVCLAFVTMQFVKHGDSKPEAKKGLEALDNDD